MNPCRSLIVLVLLAMPGGAMAQSIVSDWPCVQRLVPELSAAQMWSGPPLDHLKGYWAADPEIAPLVPQLASLDTPLAEAGQEIETFADSLSDDARSERLSLLFIGVLEGINGERDRTIAGIERYTLRQRALAEQIAAENADLEGVRLDQPLEQQGDLAVVRAQRDWDLRVFDARQSMLSQVCERPVLLEQRAFALARVIQGRLP